MVNYINLLKKRFQFYFIEISFTYLFMKNCKVFFFKVFLFFALIKKERERERESCHKWIKALTLAATICIHNIYLALFVISKSGPEFKCHLTWPIVGIYRGIMLRGPQLSVGAEHPISQRWQGVCKIQYWLTDWQDYFFLTALIAQFIKQDHVFQINWDIKIGESFFFCLNWLQYGFTLLHIITILCNFFQMIFINFV